MWPADLLKAVESAQDRSLFKIRARCIVTLALEHDNASGGNSAVGGNESIFICLFISRQVHEHIKPRESLTTY